jgi:hypothetical protein
VRTARKRADWSENARPREAIDTPLIPGKRVFVRETRPIQWDSNPRRAWYVWVEDTRATVLRIEYPLRTILLCSDDAHGLNPCDHKNVVSRMLEAEK